MGRSGYTRIEAAQLCRYPWNHHRQRHAGIGRVYNAELVFAGAFVQAPLKLARKLMAGTFVKAEAAGQNHDARQSRLHSGPRYPELFNFHLRN